MQPLQDQTVKEGNTARFDLELSHENVPVVWYRNEVKLHVSRTVLIHVEGKKHTLEMRTLNLNDTCQIKAEARGTCSTAKLTVVGNRTRSFLLHSTVMTGQSVLASNARVIFLYRFTRLLFTETEYKNRQFVMKTNRLPVALMQRATLSSW